MYTNWCQNMMYHPYDECPAAHCQQINCQPPPGGGMGNGQIVAKLNEVMEMLSELIDSIQGSYRGSYRRRAVEIVEAKQN